MRVIALASTSTLTGPVTIGTSTTTPLIIGGTTASSTLTLRSTSGVGTTDAIIFQVGNNGATEAARFITSGFMGIGIATPLALLHIANTTTSTVRGILTGQHTTDGVGSQVLHRKSRGSAGTPTTVASGDVLGQMFFEGYDGTNYLQMGSVTVDVTGTVASTRVPTRMFFKTATNATPSVLTTALLIDTNQAVSFFGAVTGITTLAATGIITAKSGTATTAGGLQATGMGTTAAFGMYYGSSAPSVSAAKGSIYLRSDGTGAADRAYINTDGSTTWTAIVTVA